MSLPDATLIYSHNDDSNFFNIVTDVLQEDRFAPYMFKRCQDYVILMSIDLTKNAKEKGKKQIYRRNYNKCRLCRWSSTSFKYTCIACIVWTRQQETLVSTGTQIMCLKQQRAISTSSGKPLNLIDQFTYLGNNISSTESNVSIWIGKESTAIDRFMIIWKSGLSDKKKGLLPSCGCISTTE